MDENTDGSLLRGTAGINQEARQIVKTLTHSHQEHFRKERVSLLQPEIDRKKADKIDSLKIQADKNKECENTLVSEMIKLNIPDPTIKEIQHEVIDKYNIAELKAFVLCRRSDLVKSKLPKKGKVYNAIAGENNLIALAFECKNLPNLIEEKIKCIEQEYEVATPNNTHISRHHAKVTMSGNESSKLSSLYLHDFNWIFQVKLCFNRLGKMNQKDINDDLMKKANQLQSILLGRLTQRINIRIEDSRNKNTGPVIILHKWQQ